MKRIFGVRRPAPLLGLDRGRPGRRPRPSPGTDAFPSIGQAAVSRYDEGGNVFFSDTVMTLHVPLRGNGQRRAGIRRRRPGRRLSELRGARSAPLDLRRIRRGLVRQGPFPRPPRTDVAERAGIARLDRRRAARIPDRGRSPSWAVSGSASSEASNRRSSRPAMSTGVSKYGAYVALDGDAARRHVLSFVTLRDSGLTERSVILFNNYLPLGRKFFLYQAAEYDLLGPAGQGSGHLTYLLRQRPIFSRPAASSSRRHTTAACPSTRGPSPTTA